MIKKIRNKLNGDIHLVELLKGSVITFIFKMLGMVLGFILIYIISNKIGAEGVGIYNLFNQILIVFSITLGLGLNISVIRYVGQFNNKKDRPKMVLLYRHMITTIPILSILIGTILFVEAEFFATFFSEDESYSTLIELVAIVLPFYTINLISVEFIRGLKKLQLSELIRTVILPTVILTGVMFIWEDSIKIIEIIYLFVAASVINFFISNSTIFFHLRKITKVNTVKFSKKELLNTSYPMMITGLSYALMASLPIFFLSFYYEQHDVGVYSIAFKIAQIISLILVIVNTIAAPKFSEMFWSKNTGALQKLVSQSVRIMFWASLILSIVIWIGSGWILNVFGETFIEGQWVLVILVLGQLINASTGSVGVLLNMSGNQKIFRNIIICSTILISLLCLILIPRYGIVGAAISFCINEIFWNITAAYFVKSKLNIVSFYLPFIT